MTPVPDREYIEYRRLLTGAHLIDLPDVPRCERCEDALHRGKRVQLILALPGPNLDPDADEGGVITQLCSGCEVDALPVAPLDDDLLTVVVSGVAIEDPLTLANVHVEAVILPRPDAPAKAIYELNKRDVTA